MRNKLKVVIDTNVFLRGWFSEEYPSAIQVMDLIDNRKLYLMFSQNTIGELVYMIKNFVRYNIDDVNTRLSILNGIMREFYYGTSVNTMNADEVNIKDKYDDIFVQCAIEGRADYLISDDFNSGMHDLEEIKCVSSKEFIDIYNRLQNVAITKDKN
jgi:putative PIN family toxin of toxin-antitoxin system